MESQMSKEEKLRELRKRFEWLERFTDDELMEIAFCVDEKELSATDQYVDLSNPELGTISPKSGDKIPPGSCYISKHDVRDEIWDKLHM